MFSGSQLLEGVPAGRIRRSPPGAFAKSLGSLRTNSAPFASRRRWLPVAARAQHLGLRAIRPSRLIPPQLPWARMRTDASQTHGSQLYAWPRIVVPGAASYSNVGSQARSTGAHD